MAIYDLIIGVSFFSDEVEMVYHQFVDVSIKVVIVRSTFDNKSTAIAEKLKAINESWKDVWPRLDVLEASCESLKEQIKRKVGSQVNFDKLNDHTKAVMRSHKVRVFK